MRTPIALCLRALAALVLLAAGALVAPAGTPGWEASPLEAAELEQPSLCTAETFAALGQIQRTGNLLLVVAEALDNTAPLNQYIAGKTAQGLTVIKYVVPAGTTKETIRTYIRSLWGTPQAPKYLLIVGDTPAVPHWIGSGSRAAVTDLYYACMGTGDDWYPEFPVGRFSVANVTELQAIVDKTLFVEAGAFSNWNYTRRGAFLANPDTNGTAEPAFEWVISTYFTPHNYVPTRIYSAQGGTTTHVTSALNSGTMFMVYIGHSGSSGWWDPSFNQTNVRNLTNVGLYPLVFGFSCNTSDYSLSECFGETWIRVANKGAAAYISSSKYIFWGSPAAWQPSIVLCKAYFTSFFSRNTWEIGPAWNAALYQFLEEHGRPSVPGGPPTQNLDHIRNFFELFVILGDPSLLLPHRKRGDLNCDGVINTFDISAFVLALTDPSGYLTAYPTCNRMLADCNLDGMVNAFDIDAFVQLLSGG